MNVPNFLSNFFSGDEVTQKDIDLMVNGLAKRFTPEQQSAIILGLIQHREKEIEDTRTRLNLLKEDKVKLRKEIEVPIANIRILPMEAFK